MKKSMLLLNFTNKPKQHNKHKQEPKEHKIRHEDDVVDGEFTGAMQSSLKLHSGVQGTDAGTLVSRKIYLFTQEVRRLTSLTTKRLKRTSAVTQPLFSAK